MRPANDEFRIAAIACLHERIDGLSLTACIASTTAFSSIFPIAVFLAFVGAIRRLASVCRYFVLAPSTGPAIIRKISPWRTGFGCIHADTPIVRRRRIDRCNIFGRGYRFRKGYRIEHKPSPTTWPDRSMVVRTVFCSRIGSRRSTCESERTISCTLCNESVQACLGAAPVSFVARPLAFLGSSHHDTPGNIDDDARETRIRSGIGCIPKKRDLGGHGRRTALYRAVFLFPVKTEFLFASRALQDVPSGFGFVRRHVRSPIRAETQG